MSLKSIRQERGLSQSDLAAISGVSINTIRSYEQRSKNIDKASLEILLKLSHSLQCSMSDLVIDTKLKELIVRYEFMNTF